VVLYNPICINIIHDLILKLFIMDEINLDITMLEAIVIASVVCV